MNDIEISRVSEIMTLHNEVEKFVRASLPKIIRIGELLVEQKSNLRHGQWESWVETNLPFTCRTASDYMRYYHNKAEFENGNVSDLAGARRLLTPPKLKVKILSGIFLEPTTFMDIKDIEPNPFFKMSRLIGEGVEHWVNAITHWLECGGKAPWWGTVVRFTGKEYQNVCEHERYFALRQLKVKEIWVCILEGERMLSDKSMKWVLEKFDYPRFDKYEAYRKQLWELTER